jgi:hypothetical protein
MIQLNYETLKELLREIDCYKLDVPKYFYNLKYESMIEIFNGAGADSTNKYIRIILSKVLSIFAAAVLIHDIDFTFKKESCEIVNKRFKDNCLLLIEGKVKKYNFFGRIYYRTLRLLAESAVRELGSKF